MSQPDTDALLAADMRADESLAALTMHAFRSLVIGVIYGLACWMIGAEPWKASVIAALIATCLWMELARHVIMRAGLIFIPYAILFWIGIAPAPGYFVTLVCR